MDLTISKRVLFLLSPAPFCWSVPGVVKWEIIRLSIKYYLNSPERYSLPRSDQSFFRDLSSCFSISALNSLNLSKDSNLLHIRCNHTLSNHQWRWWSPLWFNHIRLYEPIQEVQGHVGLRSWKASLSSFLQNKIHKVVLNQYLMGPKAHLWSIFVSY